MALQLELTQEQTDRFGKFIDLKNQIDYLNKQAEEIKKEINDLVQSSGADDSEAVMMFIDGAVIELSKPTQALKFNYDIKKFIAETNNYDVLQISSTLARKHLTPDELENYFVFETGSRKLSVK